MSTLLTFIILAVVVGFVGYIWIVRLKNVLPAKFFALLMVKNVVLISSCLLLMGFGTSGLFIGLLVVVVLFVSSLHYFYKRYLVPIYEVNVSLVTNESGKSLPHYLSNKNELGVLCNSVKQHLVELKK